MKTNLNEMADSAGRQIGDRVMYHSTWRSSDPKNAHECTITSVGEKKGRLIYFNSLGHWGYISQYKDIPS